MRDGNATETRQAVAIGCPQADRVGFRGAANPSEPRVNDHYHRFRIHGDPLGGNTVRGEPVAWLHRHADYDGDSCLIWPFGNTKHGHGTVLFEGKSVPASRAMCILVHGDPGSRKFHAAHSCGNGHLGCVHPRHLRWATAKENSDDKHEHGTFVRGDKIGTSKLTVAKVRAIRALAFPVDEVAQMFNVSVATVHDIRARRSWAWLD